MLSRPNRLSRASFGAVSAGKRAISAHFSVSVGPAGTHGAAAVISKKTAKRATDRHLLKRRIMDVAAPFVAGNTGFVVYARSGSPSLPYQTLNIELTELLSRLLIKPQTV